MQFLKYTWLTYSSNTAKEVATGWVLMFKQLFFFKLTSAKAVSSFIVTSGNCTIKSKYAK